MEPIDFTQKFKPRNSGTWRLDMKNLYLDFKCPGVHYQVDLERCTTSAEILDWIAQVAGKYWGHDVNMAEIVGELVLALDDYLYLQNNFCGSGHERGPQRNIPDIVKSRVDDLDMSEMDREPARKRFECDKTCDNSDK